MNVYSENLIRLKREISEEISKRKKKKKKFTSNQLTMIKFINGEFKQAEFFIKGMNIILKKGDEKKGFIHILKHYCHGCRGEITTRDILNFDLYLQRAVKLYEEGVTSNELLVYKYMKGQNQYKIILKENSENSFIVSFYAVD